MTEPELWSKEWWESCKETEEKDHNQEPAPCEPPPEDWSKEDEISFLRSVIHEMIYDSRYLVAATKEISRLKEQIAQLKDEVRDGWDADSDSDIDGSCDCCCLGGGKVFFNCNFRSDNLPVFEEADTEDGEER